MKITDLQLENYGIYRNESWAPCTNKLNVVMGENESGKTTLLRFIRDMMFGFERGKWQGKKGSMAFTRTDGSTYRVFRNEKVKWFVDSRMERFDEELPALWWHGLTRNMYEQIFAMGLEDLQGISFLANDSVKSRFFMLQGGDCISRAKNQVTEEMETLLVGSSQGKRKINLQLAELSDIRSELEELSGQEKDFSALQTRQAVIKKELAELETQLAKDQATEKLLQKRLGAWTHYKNAKEIKRQLSLSEQVKLFPSNGKEQWNHLVNRMKVIKEQKEILDEKLEEYKPKRKEEVIPWTGMEKELERLYIDLGQWKQMLADEEALNKEKAEWTAKFTNMGYMLSLWDRPLDIKENCVSVDWQSGNELAQSVGVRNNEIHFWEKREPEVETLGDIEEETVALSTESEWKAYEENANKIEGFIQKEALLQNEKEKLLAEKDRQYTVWFWLGLLSLTATFVCTGAFYMSVAGYTVLYGAAAAALLAIAFFVMNNHVSHIKGNKLSKIDSELDNLRQEKEIVAKQFPDPLPAGEKDLSTFRNMRQQKRNDFYKAQAKKQALSWRKETVKKQEISHKEWAEEGKKLKKLQTLAMEAWSEWLVKSKLPETAPERIGELREQWQKIYSEEGKGKILDVRIETIREKLAVLTRRAGALIDAAGLSYSATPDSIARIYGENRERNLEWQSVAERNHQHAVYEKEKSKLDVEWASCKREMDALFQLVNAKDAEDFAEKVNAHENHDRLLKAWKNVKQDLRLYAGSDEDFNRLWDSLETGEYDTWMEEYRKLSEEIKEKNKRIGDLHQQQGAVGNEIFRLAGDHTITKVLQKKKEIETDISLSMEEWLKYVFTEYILEKTQEHYEAGRQPQVIASANRFLSEMTNGKYSLLMDSDKKEVEIIDSTHHVKDSKIWSSGTGDQVYLSIRLAMALSFGKQIEPLPIVLDDIFVRFDEGRQRETLRFLMDLGKEQQIFLFTCHARTMKIAEEVGREKDTGAFVYLQPGKIQLSGA